ncbi:hypothetical protein PCC9214_05405 (plasmid) [Planktothrix tepida]|uniref:PEP-CTERM protein-sorting domain-containing protein n=1 Tax=Planktothrix tepida PCC 9214 TaxID=671072 RepID=A0A1J1LNS3_9CYAN|nr:hypothetical protein [Planktothrix tepida]CAD5988540.1 hypothetical protein PCC9214_05405 [Planktothrix tepida]CUR33894.1 exported hypothetical protein [Planktothrix tepida PCC 9214]
MSKTLNQAIPITVVLFLTTTSVTSAATFTTGRTGPDQQHGKNVVEMLPGFSGVSTGKYKIETELRIQSEHAVDRQHPYPLPEPNWQHHHALTPTAFNFSERFFILDSGDVGSEASLLPGIINDLSKLFDPYNSSYDFRFSRQDNARFVLDEIHPWSGKFDIIDDENKTNSFGFSVEILGSGGGINFGWDNPATAPFTMNFSGDVDNPKFTMSYAPGFKMTNGSLFSVNGWVKNDQIDEFGRIRTLGVATVIEDLTLPGGPEVVTFMQAPVYDVTHCSPQQSGNQRNLSSAQADVCSVCQPCHIPEPSFVLGLVAVGALGASPALRRKWQQHNSAST